MPRTNGQIAYEAYHKFADGKSLYSGKALPTWDRMDSNIRDAWEAAVLAVMEEMGERDDAPR